MQIELFKNVLWNVSIIIILGFFLAKTSIIRHMMISWETGLKEKMEVAVLLGGIGIVSTYMGVNIHGAIANTRVIGVMSAGLIGGPVTGTVAGLIAGIHRYLIDVGGFTSVACMVSTIIGGMTGGLFYHHLRRIRFYHCEIFFITVFEEILQMVIILLFTKPFADALYLVKTIFVPMVLINSTGVVLFITMMESGCNEQDQVNARSVKDVFRIAQLCLPYLRKGLYDKKALEKVSEIVICNSSVSGVAIADTSRILTASGIAVKLNDDYLKIQKSGLAKVFLPQNNKENQKYFWFSTPIQKENQIVGTLILCSEKIRWNIEQMKEFAMGLSSIFSTQLELSQLEYEQKLRKQAEYGALQSQINPHFLFNSINTISLFCRRDPDKARELLIALAECFRKSLNHPNAMVTIEEEMDHVHAYLKLEKARFGDSLEINEDIQENLEVMIPSFSLQPIVENAVKHGARKSREGTGKIWITIKRKKQGVEIAVCDNGPGIEKEVIQKLYKGDIDSRHVGMQNVYHRLLSIYGNQCIFQIISHETGTKISIKILND